MILSRIIEEKKRVIEEAKREKPLDDLVRHVSPDRLEFLLSDCVAVGVLRAVPPKLLPLVEPEPYRCLPRCPDAPGRPSPPPPPALFALPVTGAVPPGTEPRPVHRSLAGWNSWPAPRPSPAKRPPPGRMPKSAGSDGATGGPGRAPPACRANRTARPRRRPPSKPYP